MRRFTLRGIVGVALITLATSAPALAASNSAPADEYFGRYHLSILGIRNALTDMTLKAHEQPDRAHVFFNSAELTEDAVHQWQAKYPNDSWLPKTVFSLEQLYVTIGTKESAERAVATAAWLDKSFARSEFAQMGRRELAGLSTSDDGNASTPDSPTMLGMVPALTDTTVPPSVDSQAAPAAAVAVASNTDAPRRVLPSYAIPDDDTEPAELRNPQSVDITVR